ncbi:hypothetical protein [Streptomyces alfalfae]|uniref:Uncharacterized protein n=1 Tax=Streptomyces alfalfae TaxID=1642299 RepID=A0A7T4PCA3_9ACTN|nr:hypothetical protein [Streptomyces alfalfae]QQC87403.1 hypothetical protein I8755_02495 [Streptomyces alfalfae]
MVITGKRRVLYRQGTGFWRMTAKWVLVFGVLYLLDGALLRSWGDALAWPLIGVLLWGPFGVGMVWYPKKDQRVTLTTRELRVRRKRLPMEQVNLLHVARLWLEGWSTADDQPVLEWIRVDRVVWVPLHDGRAVGVEFRDPAAFAKIFGAFAVEACGGPEIVRARVARATYPEPCPVRPRPTGDSGTWLDDLDVFG